MLQHRYMRLHLQQNLKTLVVCTNICLTFCKIRIKIKLNCDFLCRIEDVICKWFHILGHYKSYFTHSISYLESQKKRLKHKLCLSFPQFKFFNNPKSIFVKTTRRNIGLWTPWTQAIAIQENKFHTRNYSWPLNLAYKWLGLFFWNIFSKW